MATIWSLACVYQLCVYVNNKRKIFRKHGYSLLPNMCVPASEGEHVLPLYHDPGGPQLLDDGQDLLEVLHLGWGSLHHKHNQIFAG